MKTTPLEKVTKLTNHRCKKLKNCERSSNEAFDHYPVDLTAGLHTMFVYCDLVQNEILGNTQTVLLRAVLLSSKKSLEAFNKLQWRRVIKGSSHSITISRRNETGDLIRFLFHGRTNITLPLRQVK